jgi:hypothetical protein
MANFIINSTGTQAIKLSEIKALSIVKNDIGAEGYSLRISAVYGDHPPHYFIFETGETLEAVQALASPIVAALELL